MLLADIFEKRFISFKKKKTLNRPVAALTCPVFSYKTKRMWHEAKLTRNSVFLIHLQMDVKKLKMQKGIRMYLYTQNLDSQTTGRLRF